MVRITSDNALLSVGCSETYGGYVNLSSLFSTLDKVSEVTSRNAKLILLEAERDGENGEVLKRILHEILSPYHTYGTHFYPVKESSEECSEEESWTTYCQIVDNLKSRELTGNDARVVVQSFLSRTKHSEWFCKLLNRILRNGVNAGTALTLYPGLIKYFGSNLCVNYAEGLLNPEREYEITKKLDGIRGFIGRINPDDPERIVCLSRNGQPIYNVDHIIEHIINLGLWDYVFDCELYAGSWNASMSICKTMVAHPNCKDLVCNVIVAIPLDRFIAKRDENKSLPSMQVLRDSARFCCMLMDNPAIQVIQGEPVLSNDDILAKTASYFEDGFEGSVIYDLTAPYNFGRVGWMKHKPVDTTDLQIVGVTTGKICMETNEIEASVTPDKEGYHYKPAIRAIQVSNGGVISSVGSGYSKPQRIEFHQMWEENPDLFKSYHLEIKHQGSSGDGTLRFPIFKRLRVDK